MALFIPYNSEYFMTNNTKQWLHFKQLAIDTNRLKFEPSLDFKKTK